MKKVVRVFSWAAAGIAGLCALAVLLFYLLIVLGLSPRLQTIWVCSAMRTMSHKYLATAFIPEETIDRIMRENEVDDSGYDSDLLTFSRPAADGQDASGSVTLLGDAAAEALRKALEAIPPEEEPAETEQAKPQPVDLTGLFLDGGAGTAGWIVNHVAASVQLPEPEDENAPAEESDAANTPDGESEPSEADETPARSIEEILSSAPQLNVAAAKTAQEIARRAATGDSYIAEGYDRLDGGLYLKEVSGLTWRGYVMLVTDPTRVRMRDTSMQYECGENVMTMVKNAGAVAGINGGGFVDGPNYDSNGGTPGGLLIEEGQLVCPLTVDETVYNMIGINRDGVLVLRHCTAEWALTNGIVSAVSFAPFLVVNGEGMVKNGTGGWGIAPRTAIGQRETGEILLLVIDGRQADWSIGCDLDVLQDVMLREKAVNAAMLDGGSSTAMVYNGAYVNRPSLGHERWINNCFVVLPEG
ncbi:MAG: phosphodiester glycosidase family protein [Ruminococcaceae bacterium]|jgi:exopolysaccharide biosynthesis protein|nr:phosphodiester glycosidase family protein [Oscillospiraceae bacterium]